MGLEKQTYIEHLGVSAAGPAAARYRVVGVREVTVVLEGGAEIARGQARRRMIYPGQDVCAESAEVQGACALAFTETDVANYQTVQAAWAGA